MDTSGKGRVKTLRESFTEDDLLGQFGEAFRAEGLLETVKPVAEISPFAILLEILEEGVDLSTKRL